MNQLVLVGGRKMSKGTRLTEVRYNERERIFRMMSIFYNINVNHIFYYHNYEACYRSNRGTSYLKCMQYLAFSRFPFVVSSRVREPGGCEHRPFAFTQ